MKPRNDAEEAKARLDATCERVFGWLIVLAILIGAGLAVYEIFWP